MVAAMEEHSSWASSVCQSAVWSLLLSTAWHGLIWNSMHSCAVYALKRTIFTTICSSHIWSEVPWRWPMFMDDQVFSYSSWFCNQLTGVLLVEGWLIMESDWLVTRPPSALAGSFIDSLVDSLVDVCFTLWNIMHSSYVLVHGLFPAVTLVTKCTFGRLFLFMCKLMVE